MQFGMNQVVQLDERRTNTEPGADRGPRAGSPRGVVVRPGARCEMLNFDLKVVDSIKQLISTFDVDCSEAWTRSLQLPVPYLCGVRRVVPPDSYQTEPVLKSYTFS